MQDADDSSAASSVSGDEDAYQHETSDDTRHVLSHEADVNVGDISTQRVTAQFEFMTGKGTTPDDYTPQALHSFRTCNELDDDADGGRLRAYEVYAESKGRQHFGIRLDCKSKTPIFAQVYIDAATTPSIEFGGVSTSLCSEQF